jgi:hypothetical protein
MAATSTARRARLASRLAGAVLLGTATLLVPKADPREHWATPPEPIAAVEVEQAADPDEPLPGGALVSWDGPLPAAPPFEPPV